MNSLFSLDLEVERHFVLKNKKNIVFNRRTLRPMLISNSSVLKGKDYLVKIFKDHYRGKSPIESYINLKCVFSFPENIFITKQKKRSRKIPDLSNLYQIVEDALEKSGVLKNDHFIDSHNGSERVMNQQGKYILSISIESI